MFAELLTGLSMIVTGTSLFYLMGGVLLGLFLGIVPGLGGITGIVVLLPFTFGMDPAAALAMLLGILAVSQTSDTIVSVMLGIPGSAASQATILDGHPMAKKGLAQTALGAAYVVSAVGGVFGAFALAASLPILTWLVLAFGSPEFFVLSVIGLLMVGAVSGSAVSKGVAAAALGLIVSQVGYPVTSSTPRYWFGQPFLLDGIGLIPIVLGLFGIPEMMRLASRGLPIADASTASAKGDSIMAGVREAWKHRWIALRCSLFGTYIGMLPGLGGSVVDWLAYGHVVQASKDKSQFGKGDIRGVIAPESANNALLGGSLIPTIAFGIPGSGAMAILLGAMTIHGFVPGRSMLTDNLSITFSMIWAIIIANIVGAAIMMIWSKQVTKAAYIDPHLVVPAVVLFIVMGSWLWEPGMPSIVTLVAIGGLGYWMKTAGWPRPPFILGFVLGPVMENSLSITAQSYTVMGVISRPTVIILTLILLAILYFAMTSVVQKKNDFQVETSTTSRPTIIISAILGICSLLLFTYGYFAATNWTFLSRLFPQVICVVGVLLSIGVLVEDWRRWRRVSAVPEGAVITEDITGAREKVIGWREFWIEERPELAFFLAVFLLMAAVPIVGQVLAIFGFITIYLIVWGHYRIKGVTIYLILSGVFFWVLYHRLLHIPFQPSMFFEWRDILPFRL